MMNRLVLVSVLAGLGLCAPSNPVLWARDTCTTNDLNLPADGMKGYNGVFWGWNPDSAARNKMSTINGWTGKKASTYGWYAQITSKSGWDGAQLLEIKDDLISSGAVLVAHVMPAARPNGFKLSDVTPQIASDIAKVVKQYTTRGVEVWLRFAHEVNWYTTDGTYIGSEADFINAWRTVHDAVKAIEGCLMFWSPNQDSIANLNKWWPGANYVDIVGLDAYVNAGATFAGTYGDFYNAFAKRYNKHMCIGETGTKSSDVATKEAWVKQLANTDLSAYPCLKSITWFEYYKDNTDFRLIMGQSQSTITKTLSNFA